MEKIKVSAKTVEEALTQAMIQLGTTSDKMEHEVISSGSRGILGIFSKPAIISAWIKEDIKKDFKKVEKAVKNNEKIEKTVKKPVSEYVKKENILRETPDSVSKTVEVKSNVDVASTPEAFITQVCNAMGINVTIDSKFDEEGHVLDINMLGEDMGILIGKRGQTLDSLQYLTGLVANKNQEEYIRVKLDTENYRERRKETLENLAKNIAFKVKRTKKAVSLEPMNPYERRLIHATLQNDRYVVTRSEGEEPFRHIVISLKREKNYSGKNGGRGGYGRYNGNSYDKSKGSYNKRKEAKENGERLASETKVEKNKSVVKSDNLFEEVTKPEA